MMTWTGARYEMTEVTRLRMWFRACGPWVRSRSPLAFALT